jgi:hypothetical protein
VVEVVVSLGADRIRLDDEHCLGHVRPSLSHWV